MEINETRWIKAGRTITLRLHSLNSTLKLGGTAEMQAAAYKQIADDALKAAKGNKAAQNRVRDNAIWLMVYEHAEKILTDCRRPDLMAWGDIPDCDKCVFHAEL